MQLKKEKYIIKLKILSLYFIQKLLKYFSLKVFFKEIIY